MKLKNLSDRLGRKEVEKLCEKKGWWLPTFQEALDNIDLIKYEEFWLKEYVNDPYEGVDEMRPTIFKNGKAVPVSINFMFDVVVFRPDKICPNCGESCE